MRSKLVCLAVALLAANGAGGEDTKTKTLTLTVSETAGLRRFGYPVHAKLKLGRTVTDKDQFRLLRDGKPVTAQFRRLATPGDEPVIALDFNVNQEPLQSATYKVEYGPEVKPGPEPKGGLEVVEDKETFTIKSGSLSYVLTRRKPDGLLRQVKDSKREYLRDSSLRFAVVTREGMMSLDSFGQSSVTRQGPIAVGVRYEEKIDKQPNKPELRWVVEATFPRSKSWVEVEVTLEDPHGTVKEIHAGAYMRLEGTTALADFGAGSMVYTTLKNDQLASLTAAVGGRPIWKVETFKLDKQPRQLLAVAAGKGRASPAEGWAHLMDRQQCTALGVDQFGTAGLKDEIRLDGEGDMGILRTYDRPADRHFTTKRLRFWLHFVPMPVQVGALTSPQSMMAPLQVEVK